MVKEAAAPIGLQKVKHFPSAVAPQRGIRPYLRMKLRSLFPEAGRGICAHVRRGQRAQCVLEHTKKADNVEEKKI